MNPPECRQEPDSQAGVECVSLQRVEAKGPTAQYQGSDQIQRSAPHGAGPYKLGLPAATYRTVKRQILQGKSRRSTWLSVEVLQWPMRKEPDATLTDS